MSTDPIPDRSPTPEPAESQMDCQIRTVPASEYKEAAQCLAEAFLCDAVVRYPIDTPDHSHLDIAARFVLHRKALEYITHAHCLRGLVTTTGPNYASVALWMPPAYSPSRASDGRTATTGANEERPKRPRIWAPKTADDLSAQLLSGMWKLRFQLSRQGRHRFFDEFLPLLHRTKREVMRDRADRCWYLVYLGTRLHYRKKGYAGRLVQHGCQMADAANAPVYLESTNDINRPFYGSKGFELVRRIYLGSGHASSTRSSAVAATSATSGPLTGEPYQQQAPDQAVVGDREQCTKKEKQKKRNLFSTRIARTIGRLKKGKGKGSVMPEDADVREEATPAISTATASADISMDIMVREPSSTRITSTGVE